MISETNLEVAVELCGDWMAIHDRMPGKPAHIRVSGRCCFPTDGWTAALGRHEPQGINRRILMLDLVVTEPDAGATIPTEEDVEWSEETHAEYDQVQILVSRPDTEGKLLDVQEVS